MQHMQSMLVILFCVRLALLSSFSAAPPFTSPLLPDKAGRSRGRVRRAGIRAFLLTSAMRMLSSHTEQQARNIKPGRLGWKSSLTQQWHPGREVSDDGPWDSAQPRAATAAASIARR